MSFRAFRRFQRRRRERAQLLAASDHTPKRELVNLELDKKNSVSKSASIPEACAAVTSVVTGKSQSVHYFLTGPGGKHNSASQVCFKENGKKTAGDDHLKGREAVEECIAATCLDATTSDAWSKDNGIARVLETSDGDEGPMLPAPGGLAGEQRSCPAMVAKSEGAEFYVCQSHQSSSALQTAARPEDRSLEHRSGDVDGRVACTVGSTEADEGSESDSVEPTAGKAGPRTEGSLPDPVILRHDNSETGSDLLLLRTGNVSEDTTSPAVAADGVAEKEAVVGDMRCLKTQSQGLESSSNNEMTKGSSTTEKALKRREGSWSAEGCSQSSKKSDRLRGEDEEDLEEAMDGEVADVLSGFERELMRSRPSPKRREQELALFTICEEEESKNGKAVRLGAAPEEDLLRTLWGNAEALSARHGQTLAQLQSERADLDQLQAELQHLASEATTEARGQGDSAGEAGLGKVSEPSSSRGGRPRPGKQEIVGECSGREQQPGHLHSIQEPPCPLPGKMNRSASTPDVGASGGARCQGISGRVEELQIARLKEKARSLDSVSLDRECRLRRQRQELTQLWRTASELGQKAAAERARAAAEKARADRAEEALAKSQAVEAALSDKLKVAVQKACQLKVALACLTDVEAEARERELEAQVSILQEQNGELQARAAEATVRIAGLEHEVAVLRQSSQTLAAKMDQLRQTDNDRGLDDGFHQRTGEAQQRDVLKVVPKQDTVVLDTQLWDLVDELPEDSVGTCFNAEELSDLRWACQAMQAELSSGKHRRNQPSLIEASAPATSLEQKDAGEEQNGSRSGSLYEYEGEVADSKDLGISFQEGPAGETSANAKSIKSKSDSEGVTCQNGAVSPTAAQSFSFWDARECESPVEGKSWESTPFVLSPRSSLEKCESLSSTSSSRLGSPNLTSQALRAR